jgi:ABC-2 type transport system permease protein
MQMTVLFIMPSIILSGFIFPLDAMPLAVRLISCAIPLTYFLRIIRGIAVKGVSFDILFSDAMALAFFGLALFVLAVVRFRKKLE